MVRAARAIITLSIVCYWCALAGGQIIGYGDNVNGIEGDGFVVWPLIVAGDPNISPTDATDGSSRIDPNVPSSPYAGVGSISVGTSRCTGSLISPIHVLSAGHCFDVDNNGSADVPLADINFNLNHDGDLSFVTPVANIDWHPEFSGLSAVNLHDDIAVARLVDAVPEAVPIYPLFRSVVMPGTVATFVGYGSSGNGIDGKTTNGDFVTKRVGSNTLDMFEVDDDCPRRCHRDGALEVYKYDFDAPDGSSGVMGGSSLGNDLETTVLGGDSGSPAFVLHDGELVIGGISTFVLGPASDFGLFGTIGGGMLVSAYADFIDLVLMTPGDINGDFLVDINDLGIVGAHFNQAVTTSEFGDLSGDGFVDIADLGIIGGNWTGVRPSLFSQVQNAGGLVVPEPTAMMLVGMGCVVFAMRPRLRGDGSFRQW